MDSEFIFSVVFILILLVLSAFFSGSETALTAASRVRILAREKEGNKRAALVNKIRERKDRMIGALLLGNNLVNIMASAVATGILIKMFGDAGVFYATIIMTLMLLIFSEVLPKTYAFHYAEGMSLLIAPLVRWVILIFGPITEVVTWIVRGFLRLFGVDISKVTAGSHLELLRGAIEMHEGPELEVQEQRAMLRSILDLADVDIEEIMIHRRNVNMINISRSTDEIIQDVLKSPHSRLPLWKDNQENIVGLLHVKNLLQALLQSGGKMDEINITSLSKEPWFIPQTTTLFDQLQAFRERREHIAIVIDEYGSFRGIVTLEDILEEIVGEIDDEHDVSVAGVRKVGHGKFMVDGRVTIRDLNREYSWGLPDEDYSTIAGLIIYESQSIPEVGQSFLFHGFKFDIVKRQRNQIKTIRVTPLKKEEVAA
ncbi:MAG: HlyC/CorC family transporter [Rhodospirillales bacterium]|nr:HlyC/CorC family transporter [Alphaproteobacteria bacterium]MCB9976715.1 HlyC/CorC family transporter [Rhodospirillales bacterium]